MAQDKQLPDQRALTPLQAKRLAAVSGVDAKRLAKTTVAELRDKLQWEIDHAYFRFRRICGTVVRRDPSTGVSYPVPNATVYVEDTDCDLLAYHPIGWNVSWYFPYHCRREVIATAVTDACGRFCVWVPRFDIDWILRWRHSRLCFDDIFVRPTIRDLLDERVPIKWPPVGPGPGPDPDPRALLRARALTRSQLETFVGPNRADTIARAALQANFGNDVASANALLDAPAFDRRTPPPLPHDLRVVEDRKDYTRDANEFGPVTHQAVRASLAAAVQAPIDALGALDLRHYVGPFRRCVDVYLPEWTRIVDVPDITFRVTQDVNGDGVQETIYSESHFDVRWNAGALPDVTLEASPIALATHACGVPPVPCGNSPAITAAGLMPLDQSASPRYYDIASGYGLRTNPPHPSGLLSEALPLPPASSPFCDTLQLYGCVRTNPAATHYRIRYRYSADGVTFASPVEFRDTWPVHQVVGGVFSSFTQGPVDAAGWYPILPDLVAPNFYPVPAEEFLLLEWPTTGYANGVYELTLELGAGGATIETAPTTWSFRVDNSAPQPTWTIEWRTLGSGGPSAWHPITFPCPVVYRGSPARDVEFRVRFSVSAPHLRSASMSASGCGGGNPVEETVPIGDPRFVDRWSLPHLTGHWYINSADTSTTLASLYSLSSGVPQGTYSFHLEAVSRAFNPAGSDLAHVNDFFYEPVFKWTPVDIAFSVIDA